MKSLQNSRGPETSCSPESKSTSQRRLKRGGGGGGAPFDEVGDPWMTHSQQPGSKILHTFSFGASWNPFLATRSTVRRVVPGCRPPAPASSSRACSPTPCTSGLDNNRNHAPEKGKPKGDDSNKCGLTVFKLSEVCSLPVPSKPHGNQPTTTETKRRRLWFNRVQSSVKCFHHGSPVNTSRSHPQNRTETNHRSLKGRLRWLPSIPSNQTPLQPFRKGPSPVLPAPPSLAPGPLSLRIFSGTEGQNPGFKEPH